MKKQPYCRFPVAVHSATTLRAQTVAIALTVGVLFGVGLMLVIISL
jgi:hypothetical protein